MTANTARCAGPTTTKAAAGSGGRSQNGPGQRRSPPSDHASSCEPPEPTRFAASRRPRGAGKSSYGASCAQRGRP